LVRDDQGTVVGTITVARDVAERTRAEAALRESDARFRALVQNSTDIIAVVASGGIFRYISPAIEGVLGVPPQRFIGATTRGLTVVHKDDIAQLTRLFAEELRTPEAHRLVAFRVRHSDGSWRHLEAAVTNLVDVPSVGGFVI